MLEQAFNFLRKKKKKTVGKKSSWIRVEFVVANGGCCLHCGKILNHKNANTEHIHDLALGGDNCVDNKIIMCIDCNYSRNTVMQNYLGAPRYYRGFPGNWDRVKEYLLWNAVTADYGHDAGAQFPIIHNLFLKQSKDNGQRISPPNYWFGRGIEETPIISIHKRSNWIIRIFDKIFGYDPVPVMKPIVTQKSIKDEEKLARAIEAPQKTGTPKITKRTEPKVPNKLYPEVDDEFRTLILEALATVEGEIKLASFSHILTEYLTSKGLPEMTMKEFSKAHGIPKRRSFIEIIDNYFPTEIGYRREGVTITYIWLNQTNQGVFEHRVNEEE